MPSRLGEKFGYLPMSRNQMITVFLKKILFVFSGLKGDGVNYKDFKKREGTPTLFNFKGMRKLRDIFSEDLSSLAFNRPTETKQLFKIKLWNISY